MTLRIKSQTQLEDGTAVCVVGDNLDPSWEAYLTREQADRVTANNDRGLAMQLHAENGEEFKRKVDERFQEQGNPSTDHSSEPTPGGQS